MFFFLFSLSLKAHLQRRFHIYKHPQYECLRVSRIQNFSQISTTAEREKKIFPPERLKKKKKKETEEKNFNHIKCTWHKNLSLHTSTRIPAIDKKKEEKKGEEGRRKARYSNKLVLEVLEILEELEVGKRNLILFLLPRTRHRQKLPGRPILWNISKEFLRRGERFFLGINILLESE